MKETSVQQQIEAETPPGATEPLTIFFAVGIVVNLVLITAFVLWAIRQWKKTDRREP